MHPTHNDPDIYRHLSSYGIRYFGSETEYEDWKDFELGDVLEEIEEMRLHFTGSSYELRKLVDLISRPGVYGPVASIQADDMASVMTALTPLITDTARILDCGCGLGSITSFIAKSHPECEVIGIDLSPVAIQEATRIAGDLGIENARFQTSNVTRELSPGPFDAVLDIAMMHEVPDPRAAFKNIASVLGPEGSLWSVLQHPELGYVEWYSAEARSVGLRPVRMEQLTSRDLGHHYRRILMEYQAKPVNYIDDLEETFNRRLGSS